MVYNSNKLNRELDIGTANLAALENAPFQQLSTGAGILQQLPGNMVGQQTVAPLPQTNPFAQAAGTHSYWCWWTRSVDRLMSVVLSRKLLTMVSIITKTMASYIWFDDDNDKALQQLIGSALNYQKYITSANGS